MIHWPRVGRKFLLTKNENEFDTLYPIIKSSMIKILSA